MKSIFTLAIFIFILGLIWLAGPTAPANSATPAPPIINLDEQSLTAELQQAVEIALVRNAGLVSAYLIYDIGIETIEYSEEKTWALVWLAYFDPKSGEKIPTEPGLSIARLSQDGWQVTVQGDPAWQKALEQVPLTLLDEEQKQYLVDMYLTVCNTSAIGPLGGYYLPWAAGASRRLSQSIFHTYPNPPEKNPTYSMLYAFDFYDPDLAEKMFPIHAAKAGTVKRAYWEQENNTNTTSPGNYIVIEDTTTSPTTYVLYLHLAKDSIPLELRTPGTPVLRGQLIGIADNTGPSTGSHLHFHVHNVATSYWGCSIDITFEDVDINGGRPRTVEEATYAASYYPQLGTQGRLTYTSGNYATGDSIPPIGDLLEPFSNGFEVSAGKLTLEGWASDVGSGVQSVQLLANYNNSWQTISPVFTTALFVYEWDLCNSTNPVPVGPLSVALQVTDYANNRTSIQDSLRLGVNNTNCSPPPPACEPGSNQVALFAEPDFAGACVLLAASSYADSTLFEGIGDNQVASLKLGSGVRATLFTYHDFTGRSESFYKSDASLKDNYTGENTLSSLKIELRTNLPAVPAPRWPSDGSVLPENSSLTLSWRDLSGADRFEVQISRDGTIVQSGISPQPYWQVSTLAAGNYSWRIRAFNQVGTASSWSASSTFTIVEAPDAEGPGYSLPFTDSLSILIPGWETSGGWSWVNDPTLARDDSYAWVFRPLAEDVDPRGSLTSPEIVINAYEYYFRFYYRYLGGDQSRDWDQRWVQISVDGGPFENIYQLHDDPHQTWLQAPAINLAPYSGSTIRIRFYFESNDPINNSDIVWAIDDLSVTTTDIPTCVENGEPDNLPSQARTISLGMTLTGSICPSADVDYYQFSALQGDILHFDLNAQVNNSELDTYLSLLDTDGTSVLAENDDEIPYQLTDSRLVYQFNRDGIYFLKVKAWNHPEAGSDLHNYTLSVSNGPQATFFTPSSNNALQIPSLPVRVLAQDNGGIVKKVSFYWHTSDWSSAAWQFLGEDTDGSDGWIVMFEPDGLTDQAGLAIAAIVEDRAGYKTASLAWDVVLDRVPPSTTLILPPETSRSTAILLTYTAQDNLSGLSVLELGYKQSSAAVWESMFFSPTDKYQYWFISEPSTINFKLRGIDQANNQEAFPPEIEGTTQILACTQPDVWETRPGGDDVSSVATALVYNGPTQMHNFCKPDDQDWFTFNVPPGADIRIVSLAEHISTAATLTLYQMINNNLVEIALSSAANFGDSTSITRSNLPGGQYYLKIMHVDGRVYGDAVAYRLFVGETNQTFFPLLQR
jgi:hypothetical protein